MMQGIPTLSNLTSHINVIHDVVEALQLPSWREYSNSLQESKRLTIEAIQANLKLFQLTFRPVFIILQYICSVIWCYASIVLKWILIQARISIQNFMEFQTQLSWFVIGLELAFVLLVIGIYMLRRYIRKKRYVEKISLWYEIRRRRVQQKYDTMLEDVARTSTTLAMMMPHLLYIAAVVIGIYIIPTSILIVIGNSWLLEVISVFLPTYLTLVVMEENAALTKVLQQRKSTDEITTKSPSPLSSSKKKKSSIPSKAQMKRKFEESNSLMHYWIRYWITFSMVHGLAQMIYLIPLISRLTNTVEVSSRRVIFLIIFVWLRFLPLPTYKNMGKVLGSRSKRYSSSTVDIFYKNMILPFLLPLANVASEDHQMSGVLNSLINNTELFLSAMVFMKALKSERKVVIIHVIRESLALLPAALSLLMPSMFTAYGYVYVSTFVATTNSAKCDDALIKLSKKVDFETVEDSRLTQTLASRHRWLQYYCVYGNFLIILRQIDYILAWVPLSTHMELIFLMWLQLPVYGGAPFCYHLMLTEFVGFGLIEASDDFDADKTLTMRLLSQFSKSQNEIDQSE